MTGPHWVTRPTNSLEETVVRRFSPDPKQRKGVRSLLYDRWRTCPSHPPRSYLVRRWKISSVWTGTRTVVDDYWKTRTSYLTSPLDTLRYHVWPGPRTSSVRPRRSVSHGNSTSHPLKDLSRPWPLPHEPQEREDCPGSKQSYCHKDVDTQYCFCWRFLRSSSSWRSYSTTSSSWVFSGQDSHLPIRLHEDHPCPEGPVRSKRRPEIISY